MWQKDRGKLPYRDNGVGAKKWWGLPGPWPPRGTRSWDHLWPAYLTSAEVFWCPSDSADEPPQYGVNLGAKPAGKKKMDRSFISSDTPYGGSLHEHHCKKFPADSIKAQHHCKKVGLEAADDVSYAFVGQKNIDGQEPASASKMRIAGDNEQEGNEAPCLEGDLCQKKKVCGDAQQWKYRRLGNSRAGYLAPGYRYVGGLETADNHGQDGVNVLYLDWHAEFDGRSWPSPLGTLYARDGNWSRYQWGTPIAQCGSGVTAHPNNTNVVQ